MLLLIIRQDFRASVRRSIVNTDNLDVVLCLIEERVKASGEILFNLITRNDYANCFLFHLLVLSPFSYAWALERCVEKAICKIIILVEVVFIGFFFDEPS